MTNSNYFISKYPSRVLRLGKHLAFPIFKKSPNQFPPYSFGIWFVDLVFYVLDILAVPEVHTFLCGLFKRNTRKLNEREKHLANIIFGNNINYDVIRVDDYAHFGTKKLAHAYVSFNVINYKKNIKDEIFIHEMVHIWQFQRFGSIYIPRAIKAQMSNEGYDYGGVDNLYKVMLRQGRLIDFNFEQQADIIEDYYKIRFHVHNPSPMALTVYHYFACQLGQ